MSSFLIGYSPVGSMSVSPLGPRNASLLSSRAKQSRGSPCVAAVKIGSPAVKPRNPVVYRSSLLRDTGSLECVRRGVQKWHLPKKVGGGEEREKKKKGKRKKNKKSL